EPVGKGARVRAWPAELDVRRPGASGPEIRGGELESRADHFVREAELPVELQRPRLHRERTRRAARSIGLVDDANPDPQPGQPESEHEAGGSGADDENLGFHAANLTEALARIARMLLAVVFVPQKRRFLPRVQDGIARESAEGSGASWHQ